MKKRATKNSLSCGGVPVAAVALVLLGLVLWTVASLGERSAAKLRAQGVDTLRVPAFVYVAVPDPSLDGEVVPDSSAMEVVERIFAAGYAAGRAERGLPESDEEDEDFRSEAEELWRDLRDGFRDLAERLLDDGDEGEE